MKDTADRTPPTYKAAREAFDRLDTQDKAAFVFEATFATLGQAIQEAGTQVARAVESFDLDDFFSSDPRAEGDPVGARPRRRPPATDGPQPGEPKPGVG